MDCDICSRGFAERRKPSCASCAQALLYDCRVQQVTALLEREKVHTHAEAIIRPGNDGVLASLPEDADFDAITGGIKRHSLGRAQAETLSINYRINQILEKGEDLKRQIDDYKASASAQKEANERRRQELLTAREELEKHRPRALEPVHSATRKTLHRLDKVRNRVVDARVLLCREAATASNFQRVKDANGRSEYILGGITIPDLQELNFRTRPHANPSAVGTRTVAEPHELVSESMGNVARLLNTAAHYLCVRLPAEMILPHEEFPRAVVMPEKSSYKSKRIQLRGASTSQTSSPAASQVLERNMPRPRNLWLSGPLAQLYKDDSKSFGMYLEGVMLLAWNLAWLCKTQGFNNINTFEDVCAVGRNLWQLLTNSHRKSQRPSLDHKATSTSAKDDHNTHVRLGQFSHNSAHKNLAGAGGLDIFQDWKLITSTRMIDKLKSHLIAEISGAEWDLLEEREWDEEREDESPVLVGGSRRPQESKYAAMSVMSASPQVEMESERATASEGKRKEKGDSGWMKVRGRADV